MIRTHTAAALLAVGIALLTVGCSTPSGRAESADIAAQYAAQDRFAELFHQNLSGHPAGIGDATATVDGYAYCDALRDGATEIDATYALIHDKGVSRTDAISIAQSAPSTLCKYSHG